MAIHRDKQGYTWIGSMARGLWRMKDGKYRSYIDRSEPYRNEVHAIAEGPDESLWVGSSFGLGKYNRNNDSFKWLTRTDGLSSSAIVNIEFDEKGYMYIGTFNGGVNYYDGTNFRHITMKHGLSSNNVSAMHYSTYYRKLFVGNEFGMSALNNGLVEPISIPEIDNASVISI